MTLDDSSASLETHRARPQRAAGSGRSSDGADANHKALAVLMQATRAVLGEIGGAQDTLQALLELERRHDVASVAAAFDALPGWQRAKIAELAQAAVLATLR